jgi:hypothetical protein
MKTTMLIGVAAASVAVLAGCATWTQDSENARTHQCDAADENCPVTIAINGNGSVCTVDVPHVIHVKKNHKPDITWMIDNTGPVQYVFKAGGIQFNNKADPVPAGEFQDKGVQGGGSGYRMKDHHKQSSATPKSYSYKITANPASGTPCVVDPIVANE